jgi:hypothetical protein
MTTIVQRLGMKMPGLDLFARPGSVQSEPTPNVIGRANG